MDEPLTTPSTIANTACVMDEAFFTHSGDNETVAFAEEESYNLLWSLFCPLVLVLGCFGNVMTMVVMRRMRSSQSTACLSVYFSALALSDLLLLCALMLWHWSPAAFHRDVMHSHDAACSGILFLVYTTAVSSAWLLVAMTGQRLVSVLMPHRVVALCTVRTGKVVTAAIVATVSALNVHFLFHYQVVHTSDNTVSCGSNHKLLVYLFAYLDLSVGSALPFLFLIVANSILVYRTRQAVLTAGSMAGKGQQQTSSRSAQVSSMTTTLMATSAVFLALTLPTCVIDIYLEEVGYYDDEVDDQELLNFLVWLDSVGMIMFICNSAVNFYIYILTGSKFRQEAKRTLCKMCTCCFKTEDTA